MEENKNVSENSTAKKPNTTLLVAVAAAVVVIVAIVMVILLAGGKKCEHIDADDNELCDLCGEAFDDGKAQTPTDGKSTYSIIVKDANGDPVSGATLVMVKVTNGVEVPDPTSKKTTDENGKASFEVKDATWKVKVEKVPANCGYILPTTTFSFTDKAATVTISLMPKYTVKVVDQNGDAVTGASVQMCAETCSFLRESVDESGLYFVFVAEDAYKAQITSLPAGYSFVAGENTETKFEFSAVNGGFTVEIDVVKN